MSGRDTDPAVCAGCGGKATERVCWGCGRKPGKRGDPLGGCTCKPIDPKGRSWKELERGLTHAEQEYLSDTQSDTGRKVSETREAAEQGKRSAPDGSDTSDSTLLDGVRDGAWLSGQDFPPLRYPVPGLIPEGQTLLVGPPKAGKSWLILDLLLAVASGGVALGTIKAGPPRRVFYLALEDGDRRMQDRCQALLAPGEAIPELFSYQTRILPGMAQPTIRAWMDRHPDTALVVLDTLGKVMPPAAMGESAYQRDYRAGGELKAIADAHPGLAVVILHHDRKAAADDFVDSVSGTHGLAGAADTVVVLCRKRQSAEGSLKITGRDVPESEYALTFAEGKAWQLDGADLSASAATARQREDDRALGATSADVLRFVNEHPEGVAAGDVAAKFGDVAYQYLKRLADTGRIDKPRRGYYVPVTASELSEVSEPQVTVPGTSDRPLSEVSEAGSWPAGSIGEDSS